MNAPSQRKRLGILCGLAIVAILTATLWPFEFYSPNRVSWLPDTNGIRFGADGVVVSKAPLPSAATASGSSCSLELLLRPATVQSSGTLLSFYVPANPKQFLVRQWTDGLLVSHDVVDPQNKPRTAKFDVDRAFESDTLLLLAITSGSDGTVVYENGIQVRAFPAFIIAPAELSGRIVLGTQAVDYAPWYGEVRGLAIYAKQLTPEEALRHYHDWTEGRKIESANLLDGATALYAFSEGSGSDIHSALRGAPDLAIPTRYAVPYKPFLNSLRNEYEPSWGYASHLLANVAGFVPLGFILCAYGACTQRRGQAILYATLAGGALSLVIEVLQAYIPQRASDLTDVLTNILGAALGALLARPVSGYLEKHLSIWRAS